MIRVVHYSNQLSLGGTERSMELICQGLDKKKFEVWVVSRVHRPSQLERLKVWVGCLIGKRSARAKRRLWDQMLARLPSFQKILGEERVLLARSDEDLISVLRKIKPQILHVWYSGRSELPISNVPLMREIPVTVTTNAFELENNSEGHRYVARIYFMSQWLLSEKARWAADDKRAAVLYCPIEPPETQENLRGELGIPETAFVLGRVGRPDPGIHDSISIRAYREIQDQNTWFLALAPPPNMVDEALALGLKNFVALPATTDSKALSKFYNTIDVLAHARKDGETFGCNIAEAMIHGKPVVSHRSAFMNAQTEVIGDTGYIVQMDDWMAYAENLLALRRDQQLRSRLGKAATERAHRLFHSEAITKKLEADYQELYFSETARR